jgi:hypothetical protein
MIPRVIGDDDLPIVLITDLVDLGDAGRYRGFLILRGDDDGKFEDVVFIRGGKFDYANTPL